MLIRRDVYLESQAAPWNFVTRRKLHDLLPLSEQKWVGGDNQRTDFISGENREGCVDFTFITGNQYRDVQTERVRLQPADRLSRPRPAEISDCVARQRSGVGYK